MGRVPDENSGTVVSNPTVNMSERVTRNIRMVGLADSGANMGVAISRYHDTNPFVENPVDILLTRFEIPRFRRRHERLRQDYTMIEEEFIRSLHEPSGVNGLR